MLSTSQVNDLFMSKVASEEPGDLRKAANAVQEYTRIKMREDGFARKILPPIPISNSDLDRQLDSDRNWVIVDKEVHSASTAMSVPYGTQPAMKYIDTDRYAVPVHRTMTKMNYKDLSTFRTDHADVRQILANNLTKDMLAEEDNKFLQVTDTIVGGSSATLGAGNQHLEVTDVARYPGREDFNDALKVLPSQTYVLPCSTVLVNAVMVNDLQKWGLDELGSELSGEIAINGWAERNLFGKRLIITIKTNLVGNLETYMFAEPKFIGKFFTLQDTTIHMERENGFIIKFFAYKEDGATIGNTGSVAKATFTLA